MSMTTEANRLAALIEDLTVELYEASRARSKEHREILVGVEDTLAHVREILGRIRKEELEAVGSKSAKIAPWFIAIASGVASLIHHLYH